MTRDMMEVHAILFDIDGTLVDSNEAHVTAWAFAFFEEGHPLDLDDIRSQIGKCGDLLVPDLLPEVDQTICKRIAQRHAEYFKAAYLERVCAFDGASELVRKVHDSGRKVILASSAKREEVEFYVDLLDIRECVAATATIDDVSASKPKPDIFSRALEKVGVSPDRALVIGDTIYDVAAASRAGVATVGLTSGPFDERQLKDAGAIAVFADVGALLRDFDASPLFA